MTLDPQPGFGRVFKPDPDDHRFLLSPFAEDAEKVVQKHHYTDLVIDQGQTSMCVGAASRGWLTCGPVRNINGPDFHDLYRFSQLEDDWPGQEPDYYGTSVRAAFKVLKKQGFVSEYRWAFDAETAINHILTVGPLVAGTEWFRDMNRVDKQGFVRVGGASAGGHAWLIIGASRLKACPDGTKGAVRAVNSWGRRWGQAGRFWLSFKDFDALIKADGEACTAFETKPTEPVVA